MLELLLLFLLTKLCGSGSSIAPGSPIDYGSGNPDQAWQAAERARREAEREAERARHRAQTAERAEQAPQPWPQAVPSGLPAFPSGWEFDEPPSKAVQQRAWQLLDSLWARGKGSIQQERTGADWITYRAEITKGGKKGVVAYRIKRSRTAPAPAARPGPATTASRAPAARPAPRPAPAPARAPAAAPAPRAASPVSTPAPSGPQRPLLLQGAGMGALVSLQPHVRDAQARLKAAGFSPGTIDGKFGAGTATAVRSFQAAKGLSVDGKIGPNTWAALDRVPALLAS